MFPGQFRYLWATLKRDGNGLAGKMDGTKWFNLLSELTFGRMTDARKIYAVKDHRLANVPWSDFQFVTPPKSRQFMNEALSVIKNRNNQIRRRIHADPLLKSNHVV